MTSLRKVSPLNAASRESFHSSWRSRPCEIGTGREARPLLVDNSRIDKTSSGVIVVSRNAAIAADTLQNLTFDRATIKSVSSTKSRRERKREKISWPRRCRRLRVHLTSDHPTIEKITDPSIHRKVVSTRDDSSLTDASCARQSRRSKNITTNVDLITTIIESPSLSFPLCDF